MKFLASALAATIAAAALVMTAPPAPARANVFCPVTIAAITDLAVLGRQDTYGVLLDFDPGDTASVRLRVDSPTTRYAVDFNDIGPIGNAGAARAALLRDAAGRALVSAWIESTGLNPNSRMECPITRPFAADEPAPVDPRAVAALEADRRSLRDNFSTKTPTVQPKSFGAATRRIVQSAVRAAARDLAGAAGCGCRPRAPCTPPERPSCASTSTKRAPSSARSSSARAATRRSTAPRSPPRRNHRTAPNRSPAVRSRARISSR